MDHIATPVLDIAYEHAGDPAGIPVVLLHGFPYDVRAYDKVADALVAQGGYRVYAPYLRGFGKTRFKSESDLRSGQQGAIGQDLLDFIDALGLDRPIVGGYDWGGRAACIVSALWPERVCGLVTADGYNVQSASDGGWGSIACDWRWGGWWVYCAAGGAVNRTTSPAAPPAQPTPPTRTP